MKAWRFARLDWLIAWRHIRVGDDRPGFVVPLLVAALYLTAVGLGFAAYAVSMGVPEATIAAPGGVEISMGPNPMQQAFGAIGGLSMLLGIMILVFAGLSFAFNLLATIITMSVLLGCMALVVVLSLMSGLEGDLRQKILDQRAHIRISREDGRPFDGFVELAQAVTAAPEVAGASPYLEGEIMVRSGLQRQPAILTGIDPVRQSTVSNLPELVTEGGSYEYLTHPEQIPEVDPFAMRDETPWRLRHLEEERKKSLARRDKDAGDDEDTDGSAPAGALDESEKDAADEYEPAKGAGVFSKLPPPPPPEPEGPAPPPSDDPPAGWEDPAQGLPPPAAPEGWEDPAEGLPPVPQGQEASAADQDPGAVPEDDRLEDEAKVDPVLLGKEMAVELGVDVGARIQLITPIGRMTPAGRIPGRIAARVAGVFFSGMYEYDRRNVYLPLPAAQAFLRVGDRVTGIEVKLRNVEAIDAGKAAVVSVVSNSALGAELVVEDWRDLNRNLFSAMFLEKVAMFIALLFVVLVASFGILASNLMSVMEKSKEIAILKAMGCSDSQIMRVFTAEGLCVGLLGGLSGIAMGLGLCLALDRYGLPLEESVYYIKQLPVVVNPFEVALVGVAALVIVWLSSLYPARVASKMRPIDGLRQADR